TTSSNTQTKELVEEFEVLHTSFDNVLVLGKRKQNSDDETDDKWAKYKKLLVTYAPETLRNQSSILQPVTAATAVSENEDNMTEALIELIKSNLTLLSRQEIKCNQVRLTVAEQLIRLNKIFDNRNKGDFYHVETTNFGISKR
ncbi:UNVERIFIED_CONTAM: hypothetical protein HDU68_000583, partial [Siphonaria sp. JEL0065]